MYPFREQNSRAATEKFKIKSLVLEFLDEPSGKPSEGRWV